MKKKMFVNIYFYRQNVIADNTSLERVKERRSSHSTWLLEFSSQHRSTFPLSPDLSAPTVFH